MKNARQIVIVYPCAKNSTAKVNEIVVDFVAVFLNKLELKIKITKITLRVGGESLEYIRSEMLHAASAARAYSL